MPLKQNQLYCVGCQKIFTCVCEKIKIKQDRNGRYRMEAKCPNNHNMFKYVKECDVEKLQKKYHGTKSKRKSNK